MGSQKFVYTFGARTAEGNKSMRILLGGKGANLAEMNRIGLPVPPGFTISTEACNAYYKDGKQPTLNLLKDQVMHGIETIENIAGKTFGSESKPLLLSVRSGARSSMPGMMDTVLNLGLNDKIVEAWAKATGNERLAWDSYRRFCQMYGSVVLGLKPIFQDEVDPFEQIIDEVKEARNVTLDNDLTISDLKELVVRFKARIHERTGKDIPDDPYDQLWGGIIAVFDSWMGKRAIQYRKINDIPNDWGTAVNVQAMVFGNTSNNSATGVAFTRDPATGENNFVGEYLINAQGEDVVAGIRTPQQISLKGSQRWAKLANISEEVRKSTYPSLEEAMPTVYKELDDVRIMLENHYTDMQDLEFTIEEGRLWILQTRDGKRTGEAMVRIAHDLQVEGLISAATSINRIEPDKLNELLHPVFNKKDLKTAKMISQGLPASPGAATGQIVFFAEDAEDWAAAGKPVILVRMETSPEDISGMNSAKGILTARGGMTSHAAVVARGMGKCAITGAGSLIIDYTNRQFRVGDVVYKEGDWISLDGYTGYIYEGRVPTKDPEISTHLQKLMTIADSQSRLRVLANADTPTDAKTAREFGARGIGLCRTEHMFFKPERIRIVREMVLAKDEAGRRRALDKLLPIQMQDFEEILEVMHDLPVTIRLLDPPLHEFLPEDEAAERMIAEDLGITFEEVLDRVNTLHETNPMLGHRGCRLANTYPEITQMQVHAILEASIHLKKRGVHVYPEIMIPLTSIGNELRMQIKIIRDTAEEIFAKYNDTVDYKVGTMIELPRAVIIADQIAPMVDFFSFGTNDLTQMTFGFSRDDIGKFLPIYLEKGILKKDPFQSIDQDGVGQLVSVGTANGKRVNDHLKVGVCGEHGGDPDSIRFFHRSELDYVSCSPFRIPIARFVAAQSAINEKMSDEALKIKAAELA